MRIPGLQCTVRVVSKGLLFALLLKELYEDIRSRVIGRIHELVGNFFPTNS